MINSGKFRWAEPARPPPRWATAIAVTVLPIGLSENGGVGPIMLTPSPVNLQAGYSDTSIILSLQIRLAKMTRSQNAEIVRTFV